MEQDKYGSEPLSNYDLIKEIANEMKEKANIVDTTKLRPNMNIEQLFQNGRGHAILFENPEGEDVGHWTILLRRKEDKSKIGGKNGSCIYFDSYGSKMNNPIIKKILKQKYDVLQYNPHQFQQYGTNPCGRYAYICLALHKLIPNLNIKNLVDFFMSKPKNISYDKWVIDLTNEVFDE